jgi:hypoxanthine phosphoribosyltransferase
MERKITSISDIQKILFQIEKSLHIKEQDIKALAREIHVWEQIKKDIEDNIEIHQKRKTVTFIDRFKDTNRDLALAVQELSMLIAGKEELDREVEKLIKKHEETNNLYESWYITNKNKVVDLQSFKQRKFDEKTNRGDK